MKLASVAALTVALLLTACGGDGDAPDRAALAGTPWVLVAGPGSSGPGQAAPSIEFDGERVGGNGGCNEFGAAYGVDGSKLQIDPIGSTLMLCPGEEEEFFAALEAAEEWRVDGAELVLTGGDGEPLRFRAASPEGRWRVTAFLHGDGVSTLLSGTEITADFAADGSLSGSGGCNDYGGDYLTDGGAIEIRRLAATEMACPDPKGVMEQEQAYLEALPRATRFRQGPQGLELLSAGGTIVATFEPAR